VAHLELVNILYAFVEGARTQIEKEVPEARRPPDNGAGNDAFNQLSLRLYIGLCELFDNTLDHT
jgi:hypothetical protein